MPQYSDFHPTHPPTHPHPFIYLYIISTQVLGIHRRMGDPVMHSKEKVVVDVEDKYWKCAEVGVHR